jgi:hypothetical protein
VPKTCPRPKCWTRGEAGMGDASGPAGLPGPQAGNPGLLPFLRSSSTPAARRRLRVRPPPPRLFQVEAHRARSRCSTRPAARRRLASAPQPTRPQPPQTRYRCRLSSSKTSPDCSPMRSSPTSASTQTSQLFRRISSLRANPPRDTTVPTLRPGRDGHVKRPEQLTGTRPPDADSSTPSPAASRTAPKKSGGSPRRARTPSATRNEIRDLDKEAR